MKSTQFALLNDSGLKPLLCNRAKVTILLCATLLIGVLYLGNNGIQSQYVLFAGKENTDLEYGAASRKTDPSIGTSGHKLPSTSTKGFKATPAPSKPAPSAPKNAQMPSWRYYYHDNFHKRQFDCQENDKEENMTPVSQEELNRLLAGDPRSTCNCALPESRNISSIPTMSLISSCGAEATALGEGQNVVSYALFSKQEMLQNETEYFNHRYFGGIRLNLRKMKLYYPDWVMRIYTNLTFEGELCDLVCSDSDIYFCNMRRDEVLHNMHPRTWRFLPLGDPTVNKFAVRDIDSVLGCRERSAVAEWEDSEFPFHGMRDHPFHGTSIMAGMWGGDNTKFCYKNGRNVINNLIHFPWQKKNDQQILQSLVYKNWKTAMLNHDSYLCKSYKDSIPFPTQREFSYEYVGKPFTIETPEARTTPLPRPCPIECRPSDGLNWEYC